MGASALHHRNLALLLSLGALPACPGKEDDTSGSGTSDMTTGTTSSTTGTTSSTTTSGTTDDPTAGTTTTSSTTGMTDTGPTETTGAPLEVPEACVAYAAKIVECYPRYAMMQSVVEQSCAMYHLGYQMEAPDCVALFEEAMVCLSALTCEEFTAEDACADPLTKLYTCAMP